MDFFKIPQAHLAGHSWGGGWLMHFAARYPDRVKKLVLIDSSGIHRREKLAWEILKYPLIGELAIAMLTRRSIQKGLEACFYDKTKVSPEMVQQVRAPLLNKSNQKAHLGYIRNIRWTNTARMLSKIRVPVLILWGRQDRYINVKYAAEIKQRIPQAQLTVIDKCGHSPHEEHPEIINPLITKFLTSF